MLCCSFLAKTASKVANFEYCHSIVSISSTRSSAGYLPKKEAADFEIMLVCSSKNYFRAPEKINNGSTKCRRPVVMICYEVLPVLIDPGRRE